MANVILTADYERLGKNTYMLSFISKWNSTNVKSDETIYLGNWRIDRVTIVSMNQEIELLSDEYELIEDTLGNGLFILDGNHFTYTGNKLFPMKGIWELKSEFQISLKADDKQFNLEFSSARLIYEYYFDSLVGYKVYFIKL